MRALVDAALVLSRVGGEAGSGLGRVLGVVADHLEDARGEDALNAFEEEHETLPGRWESDGPDAAEPSLALQADTLIKAGVTDGSIFWSGGQTKQFGPRPRISKASPVGPVVPPTAVAGPEVGARPPTPTSGPLPLPGMTKDQEMDFVAYLHDAFEDVAGRNINIGYVHNQIRRAFERIAVQQR